VLTDWAFGARAAIPWTQAVNEGGCPRQSCSASTCISSCAICSQYRQTCRLGLLIGAVATFFATAAALLSEASQRREARSIAHPSPVAGTRPG